ncbi:helix-turn-helix domain-containing protein [Streptomyces sp. NPDC014894]|uniref:helix-turn-helix domain-containing protein n=1 Tax=Streptomyces sp. NPDC014894 TaxID=3364931 RepID=UPI0036F867E2
MPLHDDEHTGARIKEQRKLARLTQRQLADRMPYSYSLLNQVECGRRAATIAFVSAVARALRIDVAALTGPPAASDTHHDRRAILTPVREVLDLHDLGPVDALTARPVAALAVEADRLCRQVRATHLKKAAQDLPGLIIELTHTAWTAPATPVWQALASAYRTASDIALKLGHLDLARIALDRMAWAAERASDPCLAAIRQYKRGLLYKAGDTRGTGQRLIAAGQQLLAGETSREALAVAGQLHLGASALAARAEDRAAVELHLAAARDLADRVGGEAPEVHWLSFGHRNADLHCFGAAVTMRQYDDALGQARGIKLPASTLTSRRARYLVDRARVEMETGHLDASLKNLGAARRAAPEQVRHYPGTRETISGLVHSSRRTPDALGRMAAWIGL